MNQSIAPAATAATPQTALAAILDSVQPSSLLLVSLNPVAQLEEWCRHHGASLQTISESDPLSHLNTLERVDLAIVADQLEYMTREAGAQLIGLLRNLHTERVVVLYQQQLAPQRLRWPPNSFLAMGMRRDALFRQDDREMALYSYDLARYNFSREWNNSRFWANPENWGKYWW
ncbi:MAG: DUF6231 family protein [Alcanivoracaceae bacterium]|jgi:hypothetical protein|nr:DUF6231 family protein [Alcanivoracaceae bacterium]